MDLPEIHINTILAKDPCYNPIERRLCPADWSGTILTVFRAGTVPDKDVVWLVGSIPAFVPQPVWERVQRYVEQRTKAQPSYYWDMALMDFQRQRYRMAISAFLLAVETPVYSALEHSDLPGMQLSRCTGPVSEAANAELVSVLWACCEEYVRK